MDKAIEKMNAEIKKLQQEQDRLKATLRRMEEVKKIVMLMRDAAISPQQVAEEFSSIQSKKAKAAKQGRARARGRVAAKYSHPTSGATWSGRGRTPRWLVAEEAAGKSREEYRIHRDQ